MPTTPELALPYPAPSDTPDVPYWAQQLAEEAEAAMATLAVAQLSDAGFPAVATNVSATTVIDRISIAAAPYDRRILVAGHAYMVSTVSTTQADYALYAGATPIGYCRKGLTASIPDLFSATAHVDLAASTPLVIEARIVRFSGTGLLTTSISSGFTNTNVTMLRR